MTTTTHTVPSTGTDRDLMIARFSWATAWFGMLLGPLHALARYRTADGRGDLDSGLVRAWADPAGDVLAPLLGWADPDVVYAAYGKLWLPVFVGFALAAILVRRRRAPRGFEAAVWWVVVVAYVGACVSVFGEYWTQWGASPNALLDVVFLASLPLVLATMLGSTVLGVTLLVKGFRPRASAVLLALALPCGIAITSVTSMGSIVLPIAFACAIAARRAVRS